MTAVALAGRANAAHAAARLDIALTEYHRRYGDQRFQVTAILVTDHGVEFTVTAR